MGLPKQLRTCRICNRSRTVSTALIASIHERCTFRLVYYPCSDPKAENENGSLFQNGKCTVTHVLCTTNKKQSILYLIIVRSHRKHLVP